MPAASLTAVRAFVATPTPARPAISVKGRRAFAFKGAGKRFGDKLVLDGIDLDVPAGQFLAVIGQSCLLYTSPSPRDRQKSRMPSSA